MNYNWDFSIVWAYRQAFAFGLAVSLALTLFASVLGTLLAVPLALGLLSKHRGIARACAVLVDIGRALPILVVLVWCYYVIPSIFGAGLSAFWTSAWVFTFNFACFAADILRGGIIAIPRDHVDAAAALGMSRQTVLRRVIVPETFRRSFAPMTAMFVGLFKLTPLASVLSVSELLHVGDLIIVERFKPLEIYSTIALLYLAVILPATALAKRLEKHPLFAVGPSKT